MRFGITACLLPFENRLPTLLLKGHIGAEEENEDAEEHGELIGVLREKDEAGLPQKMIELKSEQREGQVKDNGQSEERDLPHPFLDVFKRKACFDVTVHDISLRI